MLSDAAQQTIRTFANGDRSLREKSIDCFRAFLRDWIRLPAEQRARDKAEWPVEIKFMSEIDNACPDLTLRSIYRKELLNAEVTALGKASDKPAQTGL